MLLRSVYSTNRITTLTSIFLKTTCSFKHGFSSQSKEEVVSSTSKSELEIEEENETDPFFKQEIKKYNLGKRWLASMMGESAETFSQKDVDEAIQYLLPSHLWAKDARPVLKHPYEIFPKNKELQFDKLGRPFSSAFYTGKPKFFDLTFQIWEAMETLKNETVDTPKKKTKKSAKAETQVDKDAQLRQWMKKYQLEQKINEKISDKLYETILFRLKRLASHEQADKLQYILGDYQVPVFTPGKEHLKEVEVSNGTASAMGYRKTAIAKVTVKEGTGKITVNDKPFLKFFNIRNDCEQILFPLQLIDQLERLDVTAFVIGGGNSGKSGAVRLGMSRAIAALCPEYFDVLNNAGLLIRDLRIKERKKPGKRGARRSFQWVKR